MSRRAPGRKARQGGGDYDQVEQAASKQSRFPDTLSSICIVFECDDAEHNALLGHGGKSAASISRQIRQPLVDKLRAADLLVREACSRDKDEMFVIVSASAKRQKHVAEIMGQRGLLKLRFRQQDEDGNIEPNEGAWCPFKAHLQPLYEPSREGMLFSSLTQLRILEYIINDEDELAMGPQMVQKDQLEPGNTPLDQLIKDKKAKIVFRLHSKEMREFLIQNWVWSWKNRQPIEEIREYFGEKIALYFVWLGYYTTMLWIPALVGIVLTFSQVYSHITTGSMDNPWVPLYSCFITVWAIVFITGWKRIEQTYQYEWDTMTYEEDEEDRKEFIQNPHTRQRHSEYKDEVVRYADETWQMIALATSAVVVCSFIGAVVAAVCGIALIKFRIIQHLEPYGLSMVGKMCGGLMQATSIMIFNRIYQVVLKLLTDFENWQTETQYEDARIAKDFCFKLVNAFFACFFVAFVQNNFEVYGVNMHCPEWHCMQELTGTLASVFAIQMTVAQVLEVGLPIFKNRMRIRQEEMTIRKQMEEDGGDLNAIMPELSEEEAQSKMDAYEGVFAEYQEMVVQFGYVTLFAAAFPLTAFLALINNLVEIRTDAYKLLQGLQRPKYLCAADIGTWQVILDILSTCSILTNCALVGFTSHGLFFYFPNMNPVERVWITIICEHCLLLFKAVLDALLNSPPKEAVEAYHRRCFLRDKVLAECQFLEPEEKDAPFFTDDE
mmetsp:Transcript_9072/g.21112  ORF Transcript_9072/g.21112 Transcript_9072/m.21112 type:complete len:722 (-) Transcript_9072:33-2198(-)